MNDLPAPKIYALPPRAQAFKSWAYIANIFQERAERERRLAWEQLGTGDCDQFHRHIARGDALDEAAAWCRGQEDA